MLIKKLYQYKFQNFYNDSLKFIYTKNEKFLVLKNKNNFFYIIKIPTFLSVKKEKSFLVFNLVSYYKISYKIFLNFKNLLFYIIKSFNKKYKKILIIKGLGMRIKYLLKTNSLELKLGFTNLIYVSVPLNLKIYKNKNLLTIEGSDHSLVGNYAYLIQSLRYPDSYKGKGIWYKNQNYKLKIVKKT